MYNTLNCTHPPPTPHPLPSPPRCIIHWSRHENLCCTNHELRTTIIGGEEQSDAAPETAATADTAAAAAAAAGANAASAAAAAETAAIVDTAAAAVTAGANAAAAPAGANAAADAAAAAFAAGAELLVPLLQSSHPSSHKRPFTASSYTAQPWN